MHAADPCEERLIFQQCVHVIVPAFIVCVCPSMAHATQGLHLTSHHARNPRACMTSLQNRQRTARASQATKMCTPQFRAPEFTKRTDGNLAYYPQTSRRADTLTWCQSGGPERKGTKRMPCAVPSALGLVAYGKNICAPSKKYGTVDFGDVCTGHSCSELFCRGERHAIGRVSARKPTTAAAAEAKNQKCHRIRAGLGGTTRLSPEKGL